MSALVQAQLKMENEDSVKKKKVVLSSRTYDIFWNDLYSVGGLTVGKHLMPKLFRNLAPSSFFDPTLAWEAEKEKMAQAKERPKEVKGREDGKVSSSRRGGGGGGAEAKAEPTSAAGDSGAKVAMSDEQAKWHKKLMEKVKGARDDVKKEYSASQLQAEQEEVVVEFERKLKTIITDGYTATTKSKRTELEKKVKDLSKDTVRGIKKTREGATKSRADEIRAKNAGDMKLKAVDDDVVRIDNIVKRMRRGDPYQSLMDLKDKLNTPSGRLKWMLVMLQYSLGKKDNIMLADCYFSLLEMEAYKAARKELRERDAKVKAKTKGADLSVGREAALLDEFAELLKEVGSKIKELDDLVEFQLNQMSDRLPPLSSFTFGKSLDPWQKRVLDLIDQKKSVIVCAPTSSGKTILSSYVAMQSDAKILFVVPTDPLVWQVAAMFHNALGGNVSLVTSTILFNPIREDPRAYKVVVGTPTALESSLTKIRGKTGAELDGAQQDFHLLRGGFHEFEWVVYDEVHSLDGAEGAALQRLIRMLRCNFLALSATVGNAQQLRRWWQKVHEEHVDDEIAIIEEMFRGEGDERREVTEDRDMLFRAARMRYIDVVNPKYEEGKDDEPQFLDLNKKREELEEALHKSLFRKQRLKEQVDVAKVFKKASPEQLQVELVEHKARFINLQRWVWNGAELTHLHPLAAVDLNYLQGSDFGSALLAFTPQDSYALWERLVEKQEEGKFTEEELEDVDPAEFFEGHRITLEKSKDYEDALKTKIHELTSTKPQAVSDLVDKFAPDTEVMRAYDMLTVVREMKTRAMFPSIFFQLDTYRCMELFMSLLDTLEKRELEEYPDHYENLERLKKEQELRRAAAERAQKSKEAAKSKKRVDEDGNTIYDDSAQGGDDPSDNVIEAFIDVTAPHPDFVLTPANKNISLQELEAMRGELNKFDKMTMQHPFVRALRRGFGIYVSDPNVFMYQRYVQQFASQGKLAVVFSDESLAFGVNMPFRTCTFVEDTPGMLDSLMAAQMSGRAGRRGLDTSGNLVYLGMPFPRVKELMVGRIQAIEGRPDPRYPTLSLQQAVSTQNSLFSAAEGREDRNKFVPEIVSMRQARAMGRPPLHEFVLAEKRGVPVDASINYFDFSLEMMRKLGFLGGPGAKDTPEEGAERYQGDPFEASLLLGTMWELRDYLPESIVVVRALPTILSKLKGRLDEKTKNKGRMMWYKLKVEAEENLLFAMLLPLVDRVKCKDGDQALYESEFYSRQEERADLYRQMEEVIATTHQEYDDMISQQEGTERERLENHLATLRIDHPPAVSYRNRKPVDGGSPPAPVRLDNKLLKLVLLRETFHQTDSELRLLPTREKLDLKERLWKLGCIIRTMHNHLNKLKLVRLGQERDNPYDKFANLLLRKAFARIRYMMVEAFTETVFGGDVGSFVTAQEEDEEEGEEGEGAAGEATAGNGAEVGGGGEETKG